MHSITQGFPFEVMFLQLKQAVKGHSVMTRRCKSAIVEDRNKNLLGWMICNRVNNLWWKIWLFTGRFPETDPQSRKTDSFHAAQKQIAFAWQKTELEDASWKKCEELTESFFPRCVLLLPTFWVVVVVVLLSHVSTQPQTQTHYYVKYNMQTPNLKPYNLKIQHMENVNRRYGVRSCFHLLLPTVDAQKKKKKLCLCHPYTKTISKEPSSVPSEATDCFIQKPLKAQLQQCEKMNLKNFTGIILFFLWTWKQNHRYPSCDYC